MSTDATQQRLDEIQSLTRTRRQFDGARYGRSGGEISTTDTRDLPRDECRNCGSDIPDEVSRVRGDNRGCVDTCPKCVDARGHPTAGTWSLVGKRQREGER